MKKKIEKSENKPSNIENVFNFDPEFNQIVQSSPGIIWVDTLEEERFITELLKDVRRIVHTSNSKKVELTHDVSIWMWSIASGLSEITNKIDPLSEIVVDNDTRQPDAALDVISNHVSASEISIYIMRGMSELMMQPVLPRKLKDIYQSLYKSYKIIVITATNSTIPICLDKNVTYYQFKLMTREKINNYITNKLEDLKNSEIIETKKLKIDYKVEEKNDINNAFLGLSENEIRKSLNFMFNKQNEIHISEIIKEKKRIVEKSGILEYWDNVESMDNVGGLGNLKPWIYRRKSSLSQAARDFGLPIPRGVLIVGVPGSGKSLCCKATASVYELPLVRLDIGKVMGGIVGASESNMRKAIDVIEGISPACLWLDEVEKNLSGSSSSNYSDSGTLSRVFGTFTTWLQEKKSYVFVLATANDISQLPPELTRKGRFDEIFFVGLPTQNERKEIFNIQIKKYGRNPEKFDIERLSKICNKDSKNPNKVYNYTGAEIEEAIKDSLYTVFSRDPSSDITTEDIEISLLNLVPISRTEEEKINKIIAHGSKHFRKASSEDEINNIVKKSNINLD